MYGHLRPTLLGVDLRIIHKPPGNLHHTIYTSSLTSRQCQIYTKISAVRYMTASTQYHTPRTEWPFDWEYQYFYAVQGVHWVLLIISFTNANTKAHHPTLRLDLTVTSGATRGWMVRGSHSFTCHPHVYPQMEWAILHAFRKHSLDGVAWARWRTSGSAYYPPRKDERLSRPSWLTL